MKKPTLETETYEVFDHRGNLVETIIQTRIREVELRDKDERTLSEIPEEPQYLDDRTYEEKADLTSEDIE